MAREKGSLKTGGRAKGTPNKKSLFLGEALALSGFDLVHEFKKLYSEVDTNKKADLLMKIFEFCFPKRKSVDIDLISNEEIKLANVEVLPTHDLSKLSLEELLQLQNIMAKLD